MLAKKNLELITVFLRKLELSEMEIKAYLGLLEIGQASIQVLAQHIRGNRATVHFAIEDLIKTGLVSQIKIGKRRVVVAELPEQLSNVLEYKKEKIVSLEKELAMVLPLMNTFFSSSKKTQKPSIRFFEGYEGFLQVSQHTLDNADTEILFITNLQKWHEAYGAAFDRKNYIEPRVKRKIFLRRLILPQKKYEGKNWHKDAQELRETRFLPESTKFETVIFIYGNYVALMLLDEPFTSIIIENDTIHQAFISLFESIWINAKLAV